MDEHKSILTKPREIPEKVVRENRRILSGIRFRVDGKRYSLRTWAIVNGVSEDTALRQWLRGVRDPWELIGRTKDRPLSPAEIAWLRETWYARRGTPGEWEMACDLIGRPHTMAGAVRAALLEAAG
jgi:hypothetical protein